METTAVEAVSYVLDVIFRSQTITTEIYDHNFKLVKTIFELPNRNFGFYWLMSFISPPPISSNRVEDIHKLSFHLLCIVLCFIPFLGLKLLYNSLLILNYNTLHVLYFVVHLIELLMKTAIEG